MMTAVDDVLRIADKFSAPMVAAGVLIAAWKCLTWARPHAEEVIRSHLSFVEKTKEVMAAHQTEHTSQGDAIRQMAVDMRETREDMRETRAEAARLSSAVVERLDELVRAGRR